MSSVSSAGAGLARGKGRRRRSRPSRPRAATLVEVARAAGVSMATASRVLNGSTRRVDPALAERVLAAAARLRYTANGPAQAMARGTTQVLGLLVNDIADAYFAEIAAGVTRVADEQNVVVSLVTTESDPERELRYARVLRAQRARAVILAGSRVLPGPADLATALRDFQAGGGRVACIGRNQLGVDTVAPRNREGGAALAARLLALGHRDFGVLAGPRQLVTARDRVAGFRGALVEGGLAADAIDVEYSTLTRDGGHDAMRRLADRRGQPPSCVFAVTDAMAIGALTAMRELSLRVPEDVSVAGFDDIPTVRDFVPGLTTVRLPLHDMGVAAARLALSDKPPGGRRRTCAIDVEVVVRDTTREVVTREKIRGGARE